ncbi:hypothetical protein PGTUg99_010546 [Puccinia graminis f. sp. tritici]|uniref:Hydrophobin n=1 Tax=Puccinia graminis f. sp. tritici TaxID=56615 RepID=A0A5B0QZB1_PUCGR|nr:hypothetical protein PGTUg99_010546 [Puccinia graminis f. sp. tritici]
MQLVSVVLFSWTALLFGVLGDDPKKLLFKCNDLTAQQGQDKTAGLCGVNIKDTHGVTQIKLIAMATNTNTDKGAPPIYTCFGTNAENNYCCKTEIKINNVSMSIFYFLL